MFNRGYRTHPPVPLSSPTQLLNEHEYAGLEQPELSLNRLDLEGSWHPFVHRVDSHRYGMSTRQRLATLDVLDFGPETIHIDDTISTSDRYQHRLHTWFQIRHFAIRSPNPVLERINHQARG